MQRGESALEIAQLFGSQDVLDILENPGSQFRQNETRPLEINNSTMAASPDTNLLNLKAKQEEQFERE